MYDDDGILAEAWEFRKAQKGYRKAQLLPLKARERKKKHDTYDRGAELTRNSFRLLSVVGRATADDTRGGARDKVGAVAQAVEIIARARADLCIGNAGVGTIYHKQRNNEKKDGFHE